MGNFDNTVIINAKYLKYFISRSNFWSAVGGAAFSFAFCYFIIKDLYLKLEKERKINAAKNKES